MIGEWKLDRLNMIKVYWNQLSVGTQESKQGTPVRFHYTHITWPSANYFYETKNNLTFKELILCKFGFKITTFISWYLQSMRRNFNKISVIYKSFECHKLFSFFLRSTSMISLLLSTLFYIFLFIDDHHNFTTFYS